jgi:putative adenylate-forming enzyme
MNIISKLIAVKRLNHHFYRWDERALQKHQAERVAAILEYAGEYSQYYRKLHLDGSPLTINSVPRIEKAEMMAHFDEINTAGLKKHELIEFQLRQDREGGLDLFTGGYSVGVSSGTSGNKGLTVLSAKERELYSCLLWARNGIPASVKKRRVLFALRTNNPAFMEVQSFGVKICYVDYTHPLEDLVKQINQKKLNILAGPPSLLAMIARLQSSIDHRIEAVISYAEVLAEKTRLELESAFGAPVAEIYQGSEGFIGSTCRMGKLHINEDVLLVDLEKTADGLGQARNVVVTDLYRTTQPVIRYALNDILEVSSERCSCGSCFRVISRIHGRSDDIFHLKGPGGEVRYLFPVCTKSDYSCL